MYCKNCGNEMPDSSKFCGECGSIVIQDSSYQDISVNNISENREKRETSYGNASLLISVGSLFLFCLVFPIFISGSLSVLFGVLAIKNKEPDIAKAYVGMVIGILELIFIIACINS